MIVKKVPPSKLAAPKSLAANVRDLADYIAGPTAGGDGEKVEHRGALMNPLLKMIMMSRWFVRFMGSHLSTEADAGRALGGLLVDAKYAGVSGKYFDGFKEVPSSRESRDDEKAGAVWAQSWRLAGLAGAGA